MHCSLSDAPSSDALTLRELSAHCSRCQPTVEVDRCSGDRCSAWHTGQSGATPDSPVNYSGESPQKPEGEEFESIARGAPVSPVPQTRVLFGFFCSFLLNPNFNLFYWFVLNL